MNGRRGSILDLMSIIIVLVVFAVVSITSVVVIQKFKQGAVDTGLITGEGAKILSTNQTRMPQILDGAFIFLFVLLWVYLLIAGYLLNTAPAFLIVGLIFGIIIVLFAAPLANVFLTIAGMSEYSNAIDSLPIMNFVLSHIIIFAVGMLLSILITTYAGYRSGAVGL